MGVNKLDLAKRAQIIAMLCEGSSMRSVSCLADVSINTVSKLLVEAGKFRAGFHEDKVHSVKARRVQVEEIWSFIGAKQKNVSGMKTEVEGADHGPSRYGPRQHDLCRTREPHRADAQSPLYPSHQRIQQEIRQPSSHGRALCSLV